MKRHSLKKHAKRLFRSRLFITALLFLLQILLLTVLSGLVSRLFIRLLSIAAVFWILSHDDDPSYKISWVLLILLLPLPGCFFYLLFGNKRFGFNMKKQLDAYAAAQISGFPHTVPLSTPSPLASYLCRQGARLHENCPVDYFPSGEALFTQLLEDLSQARHFIFLEYFIIGEGALWSSMLNILEEKVKQGVEIRILYDDAGCLATFPESSDTELRRRGIHCAVFNPIHPRLNTFLNYRDHRKLCIIDGKKAYTGGVNIADEYVNLLEKHGHWKDCGIRIQGSSVENFTDLFLQLWQFSTGEQLDRKRYLAECPVDSCSGFVQPFGSDPMMSNSPARDVVLHCCNSAQHRLWLMTPYLIPDSETLHGLQRSAQSGVDVRIIVPHVADKWYVHSVTRSFYLPLLENGVRIFEYTPGFIHSKVILSDDTAVVGSINLDYRSFYLQFESAVALYQHFVIDNIHSDFLHTQEISQEIYAEGLLAQPVLLRFFRSLLRYFAPLM